MTAKEMFKKLGYNKITNINLEEYSNSEEDKTNWITALERGDTIYIHECIKGCIVSFITFYANGTISTLTLFEGVRERIEFGDFYLTQELLQAINKQVEELKENGVW